MPENGEDAGSCRLEARFLEDAGGGTNTPNAGAWAAIRESLQHNPTPAWVYSSQHGRIAWANTAAMSMFERDDISACTGSGDETARPNAESASPLCGLTVARTIETLGGVAEVEFQCCGMQDTGCCFSNSLPGWPGHLPENTLNRFRFSTNRLVYSALSVPGILFGKECADGESCCLVQFIAGKCDGQEETDMQRVMAMHEASPIFRFMFDCEGRLLQANHRAIQHCQQQLIGEELTMWSLFKLGQYDSEQHRLEEYNEAMETVFKERQTFRCQQERISRKNSGSKKWVELEMWPLTDPVTGQPAVQISQMNMTHTKKVEVALKCEKEELKTTKEALEAELMDKGRRRSTGRSKMMKSPMQEIVELFDNLAEGGPLPDKEKLLTYRALVAGSANLREPTNIVGELLHDETLEKDVGLSILQQLGYRLSGPNRRASERLSREYDFADNRASGSFERQPASSFATQSARDFRTFANHAIGIDLGGDSSQHAQDESRLRLDRPMRALMGIAGPKLVPAIERVLAKSCDWDFNVFELDEVSQHNPLSTLAFFFLKQTGLVRFFALDETRLSRWLRTIEEGYYNNSYHNRIHAADVTQKLFVMLTRGGLQQGLSHVHKLAALLAAIVHDVNHPGQTNDFLVATEDPLAMIYNDTSPLENHHLAAAFQLLRSAECNFMEHVEMDTYRAIRSLMIEFVLATDMKRHFEILSHFQVSLSVAGGKNSKVVGKPSSAQLAEGIRQLWVRIPDEEMDDSQIALKLKIALKVADLGHLAAPADVHRKWVDRLQEEFFCQGDKEVLHTLPVSPLMDRNKPGIKTAQVGFFEVVAMPLFNSLATAYSSCRPMLEALEANYYMWAQKEEADAEPRLVMRKRLNTI